VTLRLFDTAAGAVRDFVPLDPPKVGVYLCGATVQSPPHIGHMRSAITMDVLQRWLEAGHGYDVTMIRNVTDIDDKTLAKSAEAGWRWWAWAYRHEQLFNNGYATLGVKEPTYSPRATGHIPEMVELLDALVAAGHAYPAGDGSGDVYFDVRSFPGYGDLTHQRLDDMAPAEDADPRGKRDPRDFALWKGAKPGEPDDASWHTSYGRGRPGWHLECSAMIRRYLGETFDIHGGGIDLRFPHHENEQAQSRAAGWGFARHWFHHSWVTIGGEKMSKSLGNSLLVSNVLQTTRPLALRYYLGAVHYRSMIEYHEGSLVEAETAVARIETFLRRAGRVAGSADAGAVMPHTFRAAMDDDLNVSAALAVVHDRVRDGNTAIDTRADDDAAAAFHDVRAMTGVLGVDPFDDTWSAGGGPGPSNPAAATLDRLVGAELEARAAARARKDFTAADAVRDRLHAAGIEVEDTPDGARWALADPIEGG